jgi:hypothetical protein
MLRWQYRVVEAGAFLPPGTFVELLGRFGEDGWELITVVERGSALFKRPVPDGQAPDGAWAELVPAGPTPVTPPAPVAFSAAPTAPVPTPPAMSRLEALLLERNIDAPGAAAPLEEFAGRANVDALCAARSGGRDGVFIVVGNRVGVWDAETASVHPFSLAGFSSVTASGRVLTLRAPQGFDVVLTITNEASAPQWIALLGKFGVRAG